MCFDRRLIDERPVYIWNVLQDKSNMVYFQICLKSEADKVICEKMQRKSNWYNCR